MSLGRIFLVRAWKTHAEAQRRNVTDQFVMGWPSIKDTSPLGQCNVFLGTLIHAHRYTQSTRCVCTLHICKHTMWHTLRYMYVRRTSVSVRVVCAFVRQSHDYLNITLRPYTHVYGMYSMVIAIFDTPRQSRKIFRHAAAADTALDKSDEVAVESRMQKSIFCIRSVYPRYISRARIPFF